MFFLRPKERERDGHRVHSFVLFHLAINCLFIKSETLLSHFDINIYIQMTFF